MSPDHAVTALRWLPAKAERDRMNTRFWSVAARCPSIDRSRRHERKDVDVAIAAANRELVIELDVLFAAFGLRLGGVQPPGIDADLEEAVVHELPVILASVRVAGVVHRHLPLW